MRFSLMIAFGLVALNAVGMGEEIEVSPDTLGGWRLTGFLVPSHTVDRELVLAPTAQLARRFATPMLRLRANTLPTLGVAPESWPVLEIGDAALVLVRQEGVGRLFFSVGSGTPVKLPVELGLDAEGRCIETLELSFSRGPDGYQVKVGDQVSTIPADDAKDGDTDVIITAGATESWLFEKISIQYEAAATETPQSGTATASAQGANTSGSSPPNDDQIDWARAVAGLGGGASAETAAGKQTAEGGNSPASALEVFTPPSVRSGRAAQVRQSVNTSLGGS